MMLKDFGYPTLERCPNSFYKEQLEHLMASVAEKLVVKPVTRRLYPLKETTGLKAQMNWMQMKANNGEWVTSEEIGIATGINKKTASANIASMRMKDIEVKSRLRGHKPEYMIGVK